MGGWSAQRPGTAVWALATEACPLKLSLLSSVSENPSEGTCSERLWKAEAAEQGPAGQRRCSGPTAMCQPGPCPHQPATRATSSSSGTGSPRCHPGTWPGPRSGRAAHTAWLSHARLPLEGAEAEPTRAESGDGQRLGMPSLSLGLTGPWVTVTGLRKRQRHRAGNHHGSGDRASSAPFIFLCLCKRDGIRTCFISGVSMRVKWGCPQEPWALCWAGKVLNKRITNDRAGVGVEDCPGERQTFASIHRAEGSRLGQVSLRAGGGQSALQHPRQAPFTPPAPFSSFQTLAMFWTPSTAFFPSTETFPEAPVMSGEGDVHHP